MFLRTSTSGTAIKTLIASAISHHDRPTVRARRRVLLVAEGGGVAGVGAVGVFGGGDDGWGGEGGYE